MSEAFSTSEMVVRLPQGTLPSPVLLTTRQAAAYLGVEIPTLRTWRHRRRGPKSFRMEGRVVYRRQELDAYIEACEAADSRSNEVLNPLNQDTELKHARAMRSERGAA